MTLRLLWLTLLAHLLSGCPDAPEPGELIGAFRFEAGPVLSNSCELSDILVDGGFEFDATLRTSDAGAYLILAGFLRDAGYDGQVLMSQQEAPRRFAECACDGVRVHETFIVTLLSPSQNAAVGNTCPADPLGGGVPGPNPDAGIFGPSSSPTGSDAFRACGELRDVVIPPEDGSCGVTCRPCTVVFPLRGQRL